MASSPIKTYLYQFGSPQIGYFTTYGEAANAASKSLAMPQGNPSTPVTPTMPTTDGNTQAPTNVPIPQNNPLPNGVLARDAAVPTVNPSLVTGGIRGQLSNGSIDGGAAINQYKLGLAKQYGADVSTGNPQFYNFDAQNAYQSALSQGFGSLFRGLGDVKYGGQFGEYDDMGEYSRKSTAVNKSTMTIGGVENSSQTLKGGLTTNPTDYASTLPTSNPNYKAPTLPTLSTLPKSNTTPTVPTIN